MSAKIKVQPLLFRLNKYCSFQKNRSRPVMIHIVLFRWPAWCCGQWSNVMNGINMRNNPPLIKRPKPVHILAHVRGQIEMKEEWRRLTVRMIALMNSLTALRPYTAWRDKRIFSCNKQWPGIDFIKQAPYNCPLEDSLNSTFFSPADYITGLRHHLNRQRCPFLRPDEINALYNLLTLGHSGSIWTPGSSKMHIRKEYIPIRWIQCLNGSYNIGIIFYFLLSPFPRASA